MRLVVWGACWIGKTRAALKPSGLSSTDESGQPSRISLGSDNLQPGGSEASDSDVNMIAHGNNDILTLCIRKVIWKSRSTRKCHYESIVAKTQSCNYVFFL